MALFQLALWAGTLALLPYALIRKRTWLPVLVVTFFMLLIPVILMIEAPNPDWIKLVPVTAP